MTWFGILPSKVAANSLNTYNPRLLDIFQFWLETDFTCAYQVVPKDMQATAVLYPRICKPLLYKIAMDHPDLTRVLNGYSSDEHTRSVA